MHSIDALLYQRSLGLTLLVRGDGAERELAWVASSDLPDPTPFLEPDQLLLTTGSQFEPDTDFDGYVARLRAVGVVGIGFGTEVLRDGVPDALLAACRADGMTLFEVPYRTPFLALIRWVAREIEREARRRDEWALDALRAIPTASLAGGVAGALAELARRITGSVLLVDRAGQPGEPVGSLLPSEATRDTLADEARSVLAVGRRGGRDLLIEDGVATFQTLGPGGRLAGVLVVLTADRLDRAARLVVNAVVALLEVSRDDRGEQVRLALAERALRAAIAGRLDVAEELVTAAGERMPVPPFTVAVSAATSPRTTLSGVVDGVLVSIGDRPPRGRAGIVSGAGWEWLSRSVDRARVAYARTSDAEPVIEGEAFGRAVEAAIAAPGTAAAAAAALSAVRADPQGDELLRCAAVWLHEDGRWDASAARLGMHRHSLRGRIRRLAALLDLDLETFEGRVELHLLLAAPHRLRTASNNV